MTGDRRGDRAADKPHENEQQDHDAAKERDPVLA
jgi:hypothetical protein